MELFMLLMLSFGLLCAAPCLVRPMTRARQAGPMPVVVSSGKRPTRAGKRALGSERV
jgi:hypothetical protein